MKRKPLSVICFMLAFLLVGCCNKLNSRIDDTDNPNTEYELNSAGMQDFVFVYSLEELYLPAT